MQKNGNHNKQSLRPQYNQVRTQNSENNSEPHIFMETQLVLECWLNKQWNEGRNKDVLQNQWEWRHNIPQSLTFKAVSRGKYIAINAHMGSKERSKIDTLS